MNTVLVPNEIPLLVSSDPDNGARNISDDGSQFAITLQDGIKIPKDAVNVKVTMEESTIWWVIPNIIEGKNDKLYLTGTPLGGGVPLVTTITIPQGLYDLSGLNASIALQMENAGYEIDPFPITLTSDSATQKVIIRFNEVQAEIDFTPVDTFREILGYDSQVLGPYVGAPVNILADNVAAFNTVNSFLIHGDLTNKGMRINNTYSQTLGQVLIDVSPGSQIVSTPFNPPAIGISELIGATRTNLKFWLTDDKNRPVNTNGEFWTARLIISYLQPFVVKAVK